MDAQLIRIGLVLWSLIKDSLRTQSFPASVFPLYMVGLLGPLCAHQINKPSPVVHRIGFGWHWGPDEFITIYLLYNVCNDADCITTETALWLRCITVSLVYVQRTVCTMQSHSRSGYTACLKLDQIYFKIM